MVLASVQGCCHIFLLSVKSQLGRNCSIVYWEIKFHVIKAKGKRETYQKWRKIELGLPLNILRASWEETSFGEHRLVLLEGWGSIPSTHMVAQTGSNFSFRVSDALFWPLWASGMHMVHICKKNTLIQTQEPRGAALLPTSTPQPHRQSPGQSVKGKRDELSICWGASVSFLVGLIFSVLDSIHESGLT